MNYKKFKISGVNPQTGKLKTIIVNIFNDTTPKDYLDHNGILLESIKIVELPFLKPSDKQLAQAKDLDIHVSEDLTYKDVDALRLRKQCYDDLNPSTSLIKFANNHNMFFSLYIGKEALYDLIFKRLKDLDKVAFFCFCVYHSDFEDYNYNLDTSPVRNICYDFAQRNIDLLDKISIYSGSEISFFVTYNEFQGFKRESKLYEQAFNFLNKKLIPKLVLKSIKYRSIQNDNVEPSPSLLKFASNRGLKFSQNISERELYDLIYSNLNT
jgi:hypothetical protein